MGLSRNGRSVFYGSLRFAGSYRNQSGEIKPRRAQFIGGFNAKSSYPVSGNLAPSAYYLPQKSGGLASFVTAQGVIAKQNATLVPAQPMIASSVLQITVTNAQLDQIISAVGSGTLSISVASAILSGAANGIASGTMVLTVDSALCGAIFSVLASGSGSITPSVTISAIGHMDADAGGATPLSPEGLANAVWNQSLSASNETSTFGGFVQKLLTAAKFLGLK